MIFYDSVTQLIILEPISFDGSVKQKFLSAIHLSLDTRYFSPIKNFGTSPSTRVSLFDQMYAILSKQFSPEEECQPKKALFDAPLVADLSLTYDYPTLLLSLDCVDIACRKAKLDGLVSLFDSTLFGLERIPSSPPSYHSTTEVESDDDIMLESKISQVLDIFPDLKASFVKVCFEQLGITAEGLIAQLLEDSLPEDLKAMRDQPESILATRRNIHDNDEFDLLAPGRKKQPLEGVYQKQSTIQASTLRPQEDLKASTIQLVYNQYEDEYDDTYDQDIQGPAEPGDIPLDPSLKHETTLYSVYSDTPDVFQKNKEARASKARASLRNTTGMSDEQLEGWASMLRREPSRQRKLGAKHGIETETISNHDQPVVEHSAPPRAPPGPVNKAYKDRNKARFANHRRKDMHQKKLDRG
ncbi:hypothetical protein DSO57_1034442 [Entomophthora muscae]|nr:hypothetical protein DSO57_1034442 [Entomophthora muscae]